MRRARWLGPSASRGVPEKGKVSATVIDALSDDLNTPEALSALDELAGESRLVGTGNPSEIANDLAASLTWLGLASDQEFAEARADSQELRDDIKAASVGLSKEIIAQKIDDRDAARKARNFKEADRIRDELRVMGIELEDKKDSTTTWKVNR
jgi:cysteinyl-tRNA synthetase